LRAIEGTLRFRDNEVVGITEAPGTSLDLTFDPDPPARIPSADTKTGDDTVTAGDELRVRAALRRIDADLGEPVEVERDNRANAIVVTALGLKPERRRVLEGALSGLPKVQLRFRDPQPLREAVRRVPDNISEPSPQQARTYSTEFVNQTLEASESLLLRAHAIRELARHYTPEVELQLSTTDLELLQSLLADHYSGVEAVSRRVLEQARQITTGTLPPAQPPASQPWQDHAQNLVVAAQHVDQLLTKLLAGNSATDESALTIELTTALRSLQNEIASAGPVFRRKR